MDWKTIAFFAVLALLVVSVGFVFGKVVAPPASSVRASGWAIAIGAAAMLCGVIVVHEFGHLVAGKLLGMRFLMFAAGPILIRAQSDGLKLELNRQLQTWGGLVSLIPVDGGDLRKCMSLMIAGGPLASVAFGALMLAAALAIAPEGVWKSLIALGGVASLVVGAATAMPFSGGTFPTDGRQILDLMRGGTLALQQQAVVRVAAADMLGTRPRDWSPEDIRQLQPDGETRAAKAAFAHWLGYFHSLDKGELIEAADALRALTALLADVPILFRRAAALEIAYFLARHTHARDAAKAWFVEGNTKSASEDQRHRARAALAIANGDMALATEAIAEAKAALARSPSRGYATAATEWLDAIAANA